MHTKFTPTGILNSKVRSGQVCPPAPRRVLAQNCQLLVQDGALLLLVLGAATAQQLPVAQAHIRFMLQALAGNRIQMLLLR
jgi:hypothetical protein